MRIRFVEIVFFIVIISAGIFAIAQNPIGRALSFSLGGGSNQASQSGENLQAASGSTPIFANIPLSAKAVYVYDLATNTVIFAKNENDVLPLASLTKIMTALVAENTASTSTVIVHKSDLAQDGDTGLLNNEKWNLNDLLALTLTASSNDGAHAIAAAASSNSKEDGFVAEMNSVAHQLDLPTLSFINSTGLDASTTLSGGYGSAVDFSKLFAYAAEQHPELFEATTKAHFSVNSLNKIDHAVKNTDTAIDNLPNVIASKTGYTDLAGGNLSVIFDAGLNHPVIITVLGSTIDGRFTDVQNLAKTTLDFFSHNPQQLNAK